MLSKLSAMAGQHPALELYNLLRTYFKSVESDSSARRPERRNRSVQDVHEESEHRATQQSGRVAAFKTRF